MLNLPIGVSNFIWQVWEIVYSKDGSVKEVPKVMQLKGHKVVTNY